MTVPEFWASEAKREGREAADLYSEFMEDLEADLRAEEAQLREGALGTLQEAVREWNEADPDLEPIPMPVVVLEVLEATVQASARSSGFSFKARVVARQGLICLCGSCQRGSVVSRLCAECHTEAANGANTHTGCSACGIPDLTGILSVVSSSYAGSWSEPPDYEINVVWEVGVP